MHVSAGILWLLTMMAQVFAKGFRADIMRRLLCFALFWHALDIIWVAIFSVVYLLGSARMSDQHLHHDPLILLPATKRKSVSARACSAIASALRLRSC